MLQPQEYPLTFRKAVTSEFVDYVNALISENMAQFSKNQLGDSRKFMKMDYVTPDGDAYLFSVKQALAEHYNLGEYIVPPNLKDFVGYITEGGYIHPHTDPDLAGTRHVRINVLVKQPDGCIPLLEDVPISVGEGDAWLNLASLCTHSTTPVVGPGYRSAISFGYQINPERCEEFYAIHKDWMKSIGATSETPSPASPPPVAKRPPSPASPPPAARRPPQPAMRAPSGGPARIPHDDIIAIERAAESLAAGLNRLDMGTLSSLIGDGCIVMPPGGRLARGPGVAEFWRNMASETEAIQVHTGEFAALGDGIVRDLGTLSFRRKQQPETRVSHRYLAVWVKSADAWKLATMTWNRDKAAGQGMGGGGQRRGRPPQPGA